LTGPKCASEPKAEVIQVVDQVRLGVSAIDRSQCSRAANHICSRSSGAHDLQSAGVRRDATRDVLVDIVRSLEFVTAVCRSISLQRTLAIWGTVIDVDEGSGPVAGSIDSDASAVSVRLDGDLLVPEERCGVGVVAVAVIFGEREEIDDAAVAAVIKVRRCKWGIRWIAARKETYPASICGSAT
jgi:hypothetical protein